MTTRGDAQKRRTWEGRLKRFRTSDLTVVRFCEREGVTTHAFYYWSRRLGSTAARKPAADALTERRPGGAVEHVPTTGSGSRPAVVRFRWNRAVEVSIPADCLDAIRCLVECLQNSQQVGSAAFQEVVVTS